MCTLRLFARDTTVENELISGGLKPASVVRNGIDVASGVRRVSADPTFFGVTCGVSDRSWSNLAGQLDDALGFIVRWHGLLKRVMALSNVRGELDFPTNVDPVDKHVILFTTAVPARLCHGAGSLGIDIRLTAYVGRESAGSQERCAQIP